MTRVLIVDSWPVYARGLAAVLANEGFEIIGGRAATVPAPPQPAPVQPGPVQPGPARPVDVYLADLAALRGPSAAEFGEGRTAPVLLLGNYSDPAAIVRCMATGAAGYIDRCTDIGVLVAAVRTVAAGGRCWDFARARPPVPARQVHEHALLSPRERQVLRQIADGLTHGQIARRLGISPHTVDTYVKRIRSKLDLGNKAELTRVAVLGTHGVDGRAAA